MDMSSVNWLAVIVCVIFAMLSGSVWYHPKTFFPIWWKGLNKKEASPEMTNRPGPMLWILTIVAVLVEVVGVSFLIKAMGATTVASGAAAGFMLWLGLIATTYLVNNLFAGDGFKVWAIEVGNHLLNLLVFGAILAAWR
ncbi:MAG TPA: DUF1761 domain-containing protein [Anaerolineales bacterium]